MSNPNYLLDNTPDRRVVDRLRTHLDAAANFDVVSAYFSIYGYELLADLLANVGQTRFLFGDPTSIEDVDPGRTEGRNFRLTDSGLAPTQILHQKELARRCAEWVAAGAVDIRSIRQANFLHGKMYITDDAAIVGSSNFTRSGLGGSARPNLEINVDMPDPALRDELREWFDNLWNDEARTYDVKQEVLDALGRISRDYSPEIVYFKTLYEMFKDRIADMEREADAARQTRLSEKRIWQDLYEFQREGARSIIRQLQRNNGCILADSVGLGKTYTALAVIKYYELRNKSVLVLCPNKLRENWALYPRYNNRLNNPFRDDQFGYTVLAHTDLSRDGGRSGNIDLGDFNWGAYDLVVIDESHNFRNDGGKRYKKLFEEIIKDGAQTQVLMLSATPVNTSLIDLRNQIHLMTQGRADHFLETESIANLNTVMAAAQAEFKSWEEDSKKAGVRRDKSGLMAKFGPEFQRLLSTVSIARSRRQIQQSYAEEMERIGQFPTHEKPVNAYPEADTQQPVSYKDLSDRIGQFALSIYQPSAYLHDPNRRQQLEDEKSKFNFNQRDREHYLVAMLRVNFLKRLESSPHSLALTLERTIAKMDNLLERMDRFENTAELAGETPDEEDVGDDDDFLINHARRPYRLDELDRDRWRADIMRDRETLDAVRERVAAITPERDGKLQDLQAQIRRRIESPTTDNDGKENRKLLAFTTFKDTALYLYENLRQEAEARGVRMAMVAGDETRDTAPPSDAGGRYETRFQEILTDFAPVARNRRDDGTIAQDIDILIATDCISEGQNLQDCDTVVNYDIHWNPVRLIQRFGRIDRIGSRSASVRMINYWPTPNMQEYLDLENRVMARMALVDTTGGGEELFTEAGLAEGAQMELTFRDEQLRRMRDEILDIDDLGDGVVLSDFSMDYFLVQLRKFLEKNRDMLENMPFGAYAVTPEPPKDAHGPGVIFLLKQRNAGRPAPGSRPASPVHPYYLVYIGDNGTIRFGCANARQALEAFDAATAGKTDPITALSDEFTRETQQGQDMSHYNDLVEAVIAHIRQSSATAVAQGLSTGGRGFTLPRAGETPATQEDFELVTWLVIK